jgi:hypothetical protein
MVEYYHKLIGGQASDMMDLNGITVEDVILLVADLNVSVILVSDNLAHEFILRVTSVIKGSHHNRLANFKRMDVGDERLLGCLGLSHFVGEIRLVNSTKTVNQSGVGILSEIEGTLVLSFPVTVITSDKFLPDKLTGFGVKLLDHKSKRDLLNNHVDRLSEFF